MAPRPTNRKAGSQKSDRSAEYLVEDDSLASLILYHDINVRDSILLTVLYDHGPMNILRAGGTTGLDPSIVTKCVERLVKAKLIVRVCKQGVDEKGTILKLSERGQKLARRICM